ncbi:MAG TPA: hypothetical protein PKY59_18950 [Pyrinomonadaceae bacterium]|nr:hypothetical protein [Pyrinomonadaceae bacterium]
MAEWIKGKEYYVNFSNGGMEGLLEGLLMIGEKLPESESLNHTLAHFRRMFKEWYGIRSIKIEEPPEDFTDEDFVEFARLINLFCIELTKEKSELEATHLYWFREARHDFLARLMNVYALIKSHLREKGIEIPPQEIALPEDEAAAVEFLRLAKIYEQTKNRLSHEERLKLFERIVELKEKQTVASELSNLEPIYWEYIELLDENDPKEKQLAVWQRFLEIQTQVGDEEMIRRTKEMLESVEKL